MGLSLLQTAISPFSYRAFSAFRRDAATAESDEQDPYESSDGEDLAEIRH